MVVWQIGNHTAKFISAKLVCARYYRVKVALCHTFTLCVHRMIQHMHDVCMVHIRLNSVHSPKLLVAKSFTAIVRVRARVRAKEMDVFLPS